MNAVVPKDTVVKVKHIVEVVVRANSISVDYLLHQTMVKLSGFIIPKISNAYRPKRTLGRNP